LTFRISGTRQESQIFLTIWAKVADYAPSGSLGENAMADNLTTWTSKIAKCALWLTMGTITSLPSPVMAQQFNRDKAQNDMLLRVNKTAVAFAAQIGLPKLYTTYCFTKLNLSTKDLPADGSTPYGVNYITASDDRIRATLAIREEYETGYAIVCLADAKNAISAASKHE
jgi:hypothetical protein